MENHQKTEPSFNDQHIYYTKKDFRFVSNNLKKSHDSGHTRKILSSTVLPEIFKEAKLRIPIYKKKVLVGNAFFLGVIYLLVLLKYFFIPLKTKLH